MTVIRDEAVSRDASTASPNLKMGNPSGAQTDASTPDNYLLDRTYFASSYDNTKGTPNWVSWRLASADIGHAPRENFYADPDLPAGFLRVDPTMYTGSGFDRGHMCPHEDRSATTASSTATFAMTNIIPQSHDVNTMAWESLEDYCRRLVQNQASVCYILDGPAGQGGTGKRGLAQTIAAGKVVVPSQDWKVVMVLDADVAAATDLTADSMIRLIAVIMPNTDGAVTADWTPFRTTVNQVEALTGFTFFSAVDPAIINPLKGQVDATPISPTSRMIRGRTQPTQAPETAAMALDPAFAPLNQAAAGLLYPSESDAPFQAFSWGQAHGPLTDAQLSTLAGQDPQAQVVRETVDRFFDRLVHPKHAHSQVNPRLAQQFTALLHTLKAHLTDLEVVKFGRGDVAIFVFGRAKDGTIAGLKTAATET